MDQTDRVDPDPGHWLDALAGSHDRLATRVGELGPQELRRPSYCSEWTVAGVLSHLGSGAELFKASLDAALAGRPAPGRETLPAVWDRWNSLSPEAQAEECVARDGALVETLEDAGDRLGDVQIRLFGAMELDALGFLGIRLGEHALHSWDVAVAFDPAARLDSECVALLIDRLPASAGRLGKADGMQPFSLVVATDEPVRHFHLSVGDEVVIEPVRTPTGRTGGGGRGAEGALLALPAEAFLRLAYGRLDPAHAPALDGPGAEVLDRLRAVFRGV